VCVRVCVCVCVCLNPHCELLRTLLPDKLSADEMVACLSLFSVTPIYCNGQVGM